MQSWFDHKVPQTSLPSDLIEQYLARPDGRETKATDLVIWIGGPVTYDVVRSTLSIAARQQTIDIRCPQSEGLWLVEVLDAMTPVRKTPYTYRSLQENYDLNGLHDFTLFWYGGVMEELKRVGLLVL